MNAARTACRLVRWYPPAWRARYGEELEQLILEMSGGRSVPWRVRANVAVAGLRERVRPAGLRGGSPEERVRDGALLVLRAWGLFVVAGCIVQRISEHWESATPAGSRAIPEAAFGVLVAAAVVGSVLVVAGIASVLPVLVTFLRGGGWRALRRPALQAAVVSVLAAGATAALMAWAHGLDAAQRNGADGWYAAAFLVWAGLAVLALAAWVRAAVAATRSVRLSTRVLRFESRCACAVGLAMGVMTVATVTWWAALAGTRAAPAASVLGPAVAAMAVATALGALGALRAVRGVPAAARRWR